MPAIQSAYDQRNALRTTLPREGLDIGPAPDFWADYTKMRRKARPSAMSQAGALRGGGGGGGGEEGYYEPTFATMIGQGPQSAGVAYMPWEAGAPYSPLNQPFATGYRYVPRRG